MKSMISVLSAVLFGALGAFADYTIGKVYDYDGWSLHDCSGRVSVGNALAIPVAGAHAHELQELECCWDEERSVVRVDPKTFGAIDSFWIADDCEMDSYLVGLDYDSNRVWIVIELSAETPTKESKSLTLSLKKNPWHRASSWQEKTISFNLVWCAEDRLSPDNYEVCADCGTDTASTETVEPTFWNAGRSPTVYCANCGKVQSLGQTIPRLDEACDEETYGEPCWFWRDGDGTVWDLTESEAADGWSLRCGQFGEKLPATLTLPSSFRGRPVVELADGFWFDLDEETATTKTYALTIPNTVVRIGEWALASDEEEGYENLITSVSIPSSVTYIGDGFCTGYPKLTTVTCQAKGYVAENGGLYRASDKTLISVFPSTLTKFTIRPGTERICDDAFYGFTRLTSIDIPNTVISLGESAFDSCSALTTISIPESVQEIGEYAFWGCSKLASAYVSAKITELDYEVFGACEALSAVYLPATLERINVSVDKKDYGEGAWIWDASTGEEKWVTGMVYRHVSTPFRGCTKLKSVYFNGAAPRVVSPRWSYGDGEEVEEVEEDEALFKTTEYEYWTHGWGLVTVSKVKDLPVTVYAVKGTEGWGEDGTWQARAIVFNRAPWDDPNKKYDVAIDCPANGKVTVTGAGCYKAGTKVSVKATTTEKAAVFRGWYDDGGNCVSTTASYAFVMPAADVGLSAWFILPEEDYLWVDPIGSEWLELQPGKGIDRCVGWCGSETDVSLKATGLPTGLKLALEDGEIFVRGQLASTAKTSSGWVTIEAVNKTGYKQSFFVPFTVGAGDPPEVDEWLYVAEYWEMDCDAKSVTGLPAGLKYDAQAGLIFGVPTKAGAATVKFEYPLGVETMTFLVQDTGSCYLSIGVLEGGGSATGSGVYAAGASVKISAKADKGFFFAGWYDEDGEPYGNLASGDYRTASDSLLFAPWRTPERLLARFVTAAEDAEPFFEDWGCDWRWTVNTADPDDGCSFGVVSVTKPTVTAKDLPDGFKLTVDGSGGRLSVTDKAKLKPGLYTVQLSLKNLTGATASQRLILEVPNLVSEYISVCDRFDDFEPGVEIPVYRLEDWVDAEYLPSVTVTGLPKGLVFNKKETPNKNSGDGPSTYPAYSLTGVPTTPGTYTVSFTVKVGKTTETATATMVVLPFPKLALTLSEEAVLAGAKVTGAGAYMANSKVTLKATAPKGQVFAGWYRDPDWSEIADTVSDYRDPVCTLMTGRADVEIFARFIPVSEDFVELWDGGCFDEPFELSSSVRTEIRVADLVGLESASLPTIAVADLPAGLKFDSKTGLITGTVAKPKAMFGAFVVSVRNVGGYQAAVAVPYAIDGAADPAAGYDNGAWDPVRPFEPFALASSDGKVLLESDLYVTSGLMELMTTTENGTSADFKYAFSEKQTLTVTGLPPGLKLVSSSDTSSGTWSDDGESGSYTDVRTLYSIVGAPTKAGRYPVSLTVKTVGNRSETGCPNEKWENVAVAQMDIYVDLAPSRYLDIVAAPSTDGKVHGKVSGSGVYAAGATVKPTATADKDYVFAGWYEDAWFDFPAGQTSFVGLIDGSLLPDTLYARFISKAEDAEIELAIDSIDEVWPLLDCPEIGVSATSWATDGRTGSSATVTAVTGLPKGVAVVKDGTAITGVRQTGAVSPGRYAVTFTAKNLSGVTVTRTIDLVVGLEPNHFLQDLGLDQSEEGYVTKVGVASSESLNNLNDCFIDSLIGSGLTVSFSGLPAGLVFNKATGRIEGMPTKAGTATVTVKVTGNPWGEKIDETGLFFLTVEPLSPEIVGTHTGYVMGWVPFGSELPVASLSCTVSATGALSAKITSAGGTESFSAKGFDDEEDGVWHVAMQSSKGVLELAFDAGCAWDGPRFEGSFIGCCEAFDVMGWRNEHGADGKFATVPEAKANLAALTQLGTVYLRAVYDDGYPDEIRAFGFEPGTVSANDLKLVFSPKGTVTYSGTVAGVRVTGTSTINAANEDASTMFFFTVLVDNRLHRTLWLNFEAFVREDGVSIEGGGYLFGTSLPFPLPIARAP